MSYETTTALDGTQSKKLTISQYSEKQLRELLVKKIINDEMHFLTVERQGFHNFVNDMKPRFSTFIVHDDARLHEDACQEKNVNKGYV